VVHLPVRVRITTITLSVGGGYYVSQTCKVANAGLLHFLSL